MDIHCFLWLFSVFLFGKNMNFDTIEFTSDVSTYPVILLVALFIWVLSHIFIKGCELHDEHELTI